MCVDRWLCDVLELELKPAGLVSDLSSRWAAALLNVGNELGAAQVAQYKVRLGRLSQQPTAQLHALTECERPILHSVCIVIGAALRMPVCCHMCLKPVMCS